MRIEEREIRSTIIQLQGLFPPTETEKLLLFMPAVMDISIEGSVTVSNTIRNECNTVIKDRTVRKYD